MVMIRCPSCGQRTLDVASKCPKCGHVLLQNPLETSSSSDLVSCRLCGKHIVRDAAVCPYCGHHVKRARMVIGTAWALGGILVAGAVGYGVYRGGYLDRFFPDRPPELAVVSEPVPASADTVPPTASPISVPPPDTARAEPIPAPGSTQPAPEPAPRSLQTRWTSDWANVREGPSVSAPVVRVLAPGRQVDVADMRDGWWAYYEEGTMQGYIANSVLESRPPGLGQQTPTASRTQATARP